jgi:plasmid stabilization system protein ParE
VNREDQLVIHTRLPKRLVKLLDHYAIDRNLYRAEALQQILEEKFEKPQEVPDGRA